jgi:hypothetical protein
MRRSTCVRKALILYVDRFSGGEEALSQPQLISQPADSTRKNAQFPDRTEWTA